MQLEPDLLDRPAAESARAVALALLADANEAAARTGDPSDEEALHDFRVAVRRLRSTLRAWRPALGASLRGRDLRRLRRVARATNAARDVEVLLAWLGAARRDLLPSQRPAADWLARRLDHRRRHELGPAVAAAVRAFLRRAPRLARRLATLDGSAGQEPFGDELAARIEAQATAVEAALQRAAEPPDAPLAHRARIEGKRLRYLLEPLRGWPGAGADEAVKALKAMQDALGELNDARVAGAAIAAARVEAAAERIRSRSGEGTGPRSGLAALERLAREEEARRLAAAARDWLAGRGAATGPAREVAGALEARAPGRGGRRDRVVTDG